MYEHVSVTAEPVKFTQELRDMTVTSYEEKVIFECKLSKAGLTVNWLKDNMALYTDDRVYTESHGQTHRLVINQPNSDDVAVYSAVYEQRSTTGALSVHSQSMIHIIHWQTFEFWPSAIQHFKGQGNLISTNQN